MLLRLSFFFILLTMTSSAFAVMSKQVVIQNYSQWMRCHNNTTDPECPPCEDERADPTDTFGQFFEVRCLPSQRETEYVFSSLLSQEQKNERDDRICRCYINGGAGGLEAYSFSSGTVAPPTTGVVTGASGRDLNDILFNQRVLTVLSATSYTRTDSDFASLGGRYSFGSSNPNGLREAAANAAAAMARANPEAAAAMQTVSDVSGSSLFQATAAESDRRNLDDSILNSTRLDRNKFCIPYRNFLASQEFPKGPVFYQDVRGMRDFNPSDWNFSTLLDSYRMLRGSRDESEFNSSDGKQLYERLSFLYNNPVVRDVFLAPETGVTPEMALRNREAKNLVFNQIKKMPLPCEGANCSQNPEWIRQMHNYRQEMMGVLRDDRVIGAVQAGTNDYREMVVNLNNLRANQRSSDAVIGASASYDSAQWRGFCANRDRNDAIEVFDDLAKEYERNALNPEEDDDYRNLNASVCTEDRQNAAGERLNLTKYIRNFRRTNCAGANPANPLCLEDNRSQLIAQFIREYPSDTDTGTSESLAIVPYLEGELRISTVTSGAITTLNTIASSPELRDQPFEYSESGIPNFSSSVNKQVTRSPASTTTANPQASLPADRLQASTGNNPLLDPFIVPVTPQAEVTSATPEAAQAELAEGEEESQQIRDEISSLRDVLRRDPQNGGPRDSQAMTDLNQRLASLERRLRERERENTELREQIADTESQRSPAPQRAQATSSGGGESRRSGAGAAQAVAQGGASAGSSIAAPVAPAGIASSSSVSGRTASVISRPVISSGNAALLSKYGVQSGSVQGSLIVANPSTAIDYQALRSQSEGSVLSLPLPLAEYNLIASNNQEALRPYLDQCRALAGSVCRLNISSPGTSNQLELFVVKNGDDVSIIPTNSPDRRPAALPEAARVFTLNELQNELQSR